MPDAPQWPAGPFAPEGPTGPARRTDLIAAIAAAPAALRAAAAGLSDPQLDTPYRNWTVRQIVHHVADSHVNAYVRFKLALTEDVPTIKPYDETRWSALADARTGDVAQPLALLEAVHARWVQLLGVMTDDDFTRPFFHPEHGRAIRLDESLAQYVWHARHHTAQVLWVRARHGW
ncbi:MAG TPA: putative metal-dependent hydrolase [Urbifossiella sp.]|nr:putative metal-dependent hydrolase [Urbifossiella sp.]